MQYFKLIFHIDLPGRYIINYSCLLAPPSDKHCFKSLFPKLTRMYQCLSLKNSRISSNLILTLALEELKDPRKYFIGTSWNLTFDKWHRVETTFPSDILCYAQAEVFGSHGLAQLTHKHAYPSIFNAWPLTRQWRTAKGRTAYRDTSQPVTITVAVASIPPSAFPRCVIASAICCLTSIESQDVCKFSHDMKFIKFEQRVNLTCSQNNEIYLIIINLALVLPGSLLPFFA